MSDGFKKFIDTGGKTLDEIKKNISRILNDTISSVNSAAEEAAKFASPELKKRIERAVDEARKSAEKEYKPERIPPKKPNINYASANAKAARNEAPKPRGSGATAYPHEPVPAHLSPQDELMMNRISRMRALEEVSHNGYIVKRCAEVTLVRQGLYMADVEDDFERRVFCAVPRPVYAAMSNSQLRTYFTWRTDARRGKYSEIDKPYVLLYCYELLNKIGAANACEAFEKLLELWEGCGEFAGYLDDVMPRWLKDFYAYNNVTERFPDISALPRFAPGSPQNFAAAEIDAGNYADKLDFLADNSAYNLKGSIFFSEETKPLLNGACEYALNALAKYFKTRGTELSALLCGKLKKDYSWSPFCGALVDIDRTEGFRPVTISAAERYCIKRGEPALECFEFSPAKGFIGYLLKSVEAELRKKTGFKRGITANITMLQSDVKNREKLTAAISDPEFLKVIPAAVSEFCRKNNIAPRKKTAEAREVCPREKVEIDVSRLKKIREESDAVAKKLIVAESDSPNEDIIEEIAARIFDDDFSERIDDCRGLAPNDAVVGLEAICARSENPVFEQLSEEWKAFANNLTPTQVFVLKALQNGNAAEHCRENGLLPETVFEEINTEALAALEDVVIEGGEIIPDYSENIARIVAAAGLAFK